MDSTFRPRAVAFDPVAFQFLEAYVDSFVKWDVLHFFYHHAHAVNTAEAVALAINRDSATVARELHELAEAGVLQETQLGEVQVYALSNDPEISAGLRAFIEAATQDEFRYRAVFHLVRGRSWREQTYE